MSYLLEIRELAKEEILPGIKHRDFQYTLKPAIWKFSINPATTGTQPYWAEKQLQVNYFGSTNHQHTVTVTISDSTNWFLHPGLHLTKGVESRNYKVVLKDQERFQTTSLLAAPFVIYARSLANAPMGLDQTPSVRALSNGRAWLGSLCRRSHLKMLQGIAPAWKGHMRNSLATLCTQKLAVLNSIKLPKSVSPALNKPFTSITEKEDQDAQRRWPRLNLLPRKDDKRFFFKFSNANGANLYRIVFILLTWFSAESDTILSIWGRALGSLNVCEWEEYHCFHYWALRPDLSFAVLSGISRQDAFP